MFAIYTLYKKGSNHHYLGVSTTHLIINQRDKRHIYDLQSLQSVTIDKKKKLIPLITGGIISSLSLLEMVLDIVSFDMIALLSAGLLLLYYGFTEYVVIHVVTGNTEVKFWLNHKHRLQQVRPFIGIVEFFAHHKRFPPLYVNVPYHAVTSHIHNQQGPVESKIKLFYRLFSKTTPSISAIIVDPVRLDAPIHFKSEDNQIAWGDHLINQSAIIGVDQHSGS